MKKPKTFIIFGKRIKIQYAPDLIEKYDINGDYGQDLIRIDEQLEDKLLWLTLIHEATHALFDRCGIRQAVDSGVEEIICDNISTLMVENFELAIKKNAPRKPRGGP